MKDDHRASCRIIAEGTGYQKPSFTAFCLIIRNNKNCMHDLLPHVLTAEQWEQRIVYTKDLTHFPYSPDLSPPDYFAFPKLKMELKGDQYATISDIQTSVTTKLKTISLTDSSPAMQQLEDRTNQCIVVNGDYIE